MEGTITAENKFCDDRFFHNLNKKCNCLSVVTVFCSLDLNIIKVIKGKKSVIKSSYKIVIERLAYETTDDAIQITAFNGLEILKMDVPYRLVIIPSVRQPEMLSQT